jgi:hypothetical protein
MAQEKVILTITLNEDSTVNVTGPIRDRLLCYGLLEEARQIIHEYGKKAESRVVPVTLVPPINRLS